MNPHRVAATVVAFTLLTAACGDDGSSSSDASATTASSVTSTTTEFVQHGFHELLANGVRNRLAQLIPDRFTLDENSIREVDLYPESTGRTRVEIEFQTQKELNEFAVEQGMIGFYNAEFTAQGGEEFWAVFTQVFRTLDGPPVVFDRFGNTETVAIDDAPRIDSAEAEVGGGAQGVFFVDTYQYEDGSRAVAMRGTVVDTNALHHVSAIVDAPAGTAFDGVAEMRRVLRGLVGLHRALFEEFLRLGLGENVPPEEDGP